MTETTGNHSNLPQATAPSVFRHEGRRLFLIDGEPRVADEDLAKDLEMARKRSIRWNLIDANRDKLLMLGSILQIDPQSHSLICHGSGDVLHPPFEKAVAEAVLPLLKAEGLIDPSKRGEKPKINFLNAEQAKFLIVMSGMPKGRDLLVDLIKLEKAWRDGTLEPARPAVEPARPAVEPPPAAAAPKVVEVRIAPHRMAEGPVRRAAAGGSSGEALGMPLQSRIMHDGLVYELAGGRLCLVWSRAEDHLRIDRIVARCGAALSIIDPVRSSAHSPGAVLFGARHVGFLRRMVDRQPRSFLGGDFNRLDGALRVLRGHARRAAS